MAKVFLRTEYNYDMHAASLESALVCPPEEGRTKQEFAEDADINVVLRRYGVNKEQVVDFGRPQPADVDFGDGFDFRASLHAVMEAQSAFDALPSRVRERFRNDPQELISFVENPANREEAEFLGLVPKAPSGGGVGGSPPTAAEAASAAAPAEPKP